MVRFFVNPDELINDSVIITGENAAHAKVLRIKVGEQVLVCVQKSGVFEALEAKGCKEGDTVSIYDFEFDYVK